LHFLDALCQRIAGPLRVVAQNTHANVAPIFHGSHPAAGCPSVPPHLFSGRLLPNGSPVCAFPSFPRDLTVQFGCGRPPSRQRVQCSICTVVFTVSNPLRPAAPVWRTPVISFVHVPLNKPFLFLASPSPESGNKAGGERVARSARLLRGGHFVDTGDLGYTGGHGWATTCTVYTVESALTEAVNHFRVPEARRLSQSGHGRPTCRTTGDGEQWDRGLGAELEKIAGSAEWLVVQIPVQQCVLAAFPMKEPRSRFLFLTQRSSIPGEMGTWRQPTGMRLGTPGHPNAILFCPRGLAQHASMHHATRRGGLAAGEGWRRLDPTGAETGAAPRS
jgi:hypothetical protein